MSSTKAPRERGIIFSSPMILALQRDPPKTMTRRLHDVGKPGDHLWVRETWRTEEEGSGDLVDGIRFAADAAFVPIEATTEAADRWVDAHANGKHNADWRPSIYIPRWASRFLLEIVAVREEKIQDITTADIIAEGIQIPVSTEGCPPGKCVPLVRFTGDKFSPHRYLPKPGRPGGFTEDDYYRAEWASGWNKINGRRAPWEQNPTVRVVTFKRLS